MAKFELSKSVEGVKVNKRSGIPTTERISLAFGAIIEDPREERDCLRFKYLLDIVDVKLSEIDGYYKPIDGAAAPASSPTAQSPAAPADTRFIRWESIPSNIPTSRAKVPGGWLISTSSGLTFLPDPDHAWAGSSL
jgi:hypothetical protein